MRVFLLLLPFFLFHVAFTQKPVIDYDAIEQWEEVGGSPGISSKGTYVFYDVVNVVTGKSRVVVKRADNTWERVFDGEYTGGFGFFSTDEKHFLFADRKKELKLLHLPEDSLYSLPGAKEWRLIKGKLDDFLVYTKGIDTVVTYHLNNKLERFFVGFAVVTTNATGTSMILQKENVKEYYLLRPERGEMQLMVEKVQADGFVFDADCKWIAYNTLDSASDRSAHRIRSIWLYDIAGRKTSKILDDNNEELSEGVCINGVKGFTASGSGIYLDVKECQEVGVGPSKQAGNLALCIWNTRDVMPPLFKKYESQSADEEKEKLFNALFVVKSKRFIQLDCDSLTSIKLSNDYWIFERKMNREDRVYLVSGETGVEKQLPNFIIGKRMHLWLSPSAKYLVYYDYKIKNYIRYDIAVGSFLNLTEQLNVDWVQKFDGPRGVDGFAMQAGWISGTDYLVVNAYSDLWMLDVSGRKKHKNLTVGLRGGENVIFTVASISTNGMISAKDNQLLYAFNRDNKKNSFYEVDFLKVGKPHFLSAWDYTFYTPGSKNYNARNFVPIKANDTSVYLVRGMSAKESPNFFTTEDFRSFNRVSNILPEKKYNWLIAELKTWLLPNGKSAQGILYKPENFDSTKKYPVIVNYYEQHSDDLFAFLKPALSVGDIDVAWFTSRGYLVFRPDINYEMGYPGKSTLVSISSGVNCIGKLPYVDLSKMGVSGHSLGGFETNYLITHTDRFKAAMSAAGASNMVSNYGSVWGKTGESKSDFVENSQYRMASSLADSPELYLENSPVLLANKVKTPLLLMHNIDDTSVPFGQSVELFTSLRRSGKLAWLLQYDNAQHTIRDKELTRDFTKRMTDFFDYYLKDGKNMPCWMLSTGSIKSKLECD